MIAMTEKEIWIFLSHSNEDYDKVRKVRNMLEDLNLRPIMFFLKCLNDDDEIDELIKREIDCRTRFILCDSDNARKSNWVKREVEYIKSKDKPYEIIDLSNSDEYILHQLKEVRRRMSLYISYSRKDLSLATQIYERLSKYDYDVFLDSEHSFMVENSFVDEKDKNILGTVANGYIIPLLTQNGINSCWVNEEIKRARKYDKAQGNNHSSVIPIVIDAPIPEEYSDLECIIIPENTTDLANSVVDSVLKRLLHHSQILTYYYRFSKSKYDKSDIFEAKRLGKIYFEWADKRSANYPPAVMALGYCYEHGIGTEIDLLQAYYQYSYYVGNDGMGRSSVERLLPTLREKYPERFAPYNPPQKIPFKQLLCNLLRILFIEIPKDSFYYLKSFISNG